MRPSNGSSQEPSPSGLRILMLGPVNSPHVEHLASAMHDRGHAVHLAGEMESTLPSPELPVAGIPVFVRPRGRAADTPGTGLPIRVRWLRHLLRRIQPDVVHAHVLPGFPFVALLAGARPLVATAWGSDVLVANRRMRLRNRLVARRADMVTADSKLLIGRLRELGAPTERTVLLNWGVDLSIFSLAASRERAKQQLGLAGGPVMLSPRGLAPNYNHRVILDAFAKVAASRPDVSLVLKHIESDSGIPRPELGEIPYPGRVRIVGHVEYSDMPLYYQAADVCISIPSSDSSPRSVWEAMACGCPCVLSDLPWVRDLISPGDDALVVPPDADAVAGAVMRILSDADLAAAMSARARALVEAHRNQATEMDRLVALYEHLARAHRGLRVGHRGLRVGGAGR